MSEVSSLSDRQVCEKGELPRGRPGRAWTDAAGPRIYNPCSYLNERETGAHLSQSPVHRRSEQCQVIRAAGASSLAARHFPIGKCALSRPCRALKRRNRTRG